MNLRRILAAAIRRHSELAGTRIRLTGEDIKPFTRIVSGKQKRLFRAETRALDGRAVFIESTAPMQPCLRGFRLEWVSRNHIRISPAP